MIRIDSRKRPRERGQILVLFALMLSVLMILAALLYSGANTLVNRRQLQNAGDAAALAAANLMTNGTSLCNSTRISPTLSGNDLYVAAKNSVMTNLGWTAAQVTSRMTVSCPSASAYGSVAVQVSLSVTGPKWFGTGGLQVTTASTGINGQVTNGEYSVALLDPMPTLTDGSLWSGSVGCPSYQFNGGVTVTYEGSVFVDSTCTRTINNSGAVDAHNSAFSMTLVNGARLLTGGETSSGTISKITPTPSENVRPLLADPFSGLIPPCKAGSSSNCLGGSTALPSRDYGTNGQGLCKNTKVACVLQPGTYSGGILAANGNALPTLLLRPGVYYIDGGGVQLKSAAAQIIAIPSATTGKCTGTSTVTCTDTDAITRYCNPTNQNNGSCQLSSASTPTVASNWQTDCPQPPAATTCGVLIYNATTAGNTAWTVNGNNTDNIQSGSQGTMLLRAYNPTYDSISGNGTTFASYKNLVIWQAREPLPATTLPQPIITMAGGACVVMSGSVYASGGAVQFGGESCGSGGGDTEMTLQFVCWDLTLSGNNNFYFAYRRNSLATPFAYGLVP